MRTTRYFRALWRFPACALSLVFLGVALLSPFGAAGGERPKAKPYAVIFGTVWDPDGHPVYGVKVKIRRADEKKTRWELYSDHMGEFAQRLPAGAADYVISADLKGFKSPPGRHLRPGNDVTVHIDNEERADTGLHLIW
jgi:hypothetical protein